MTTTEASLGRAAEIIDTYAGLGLRGVFLRPISPYGFALRSRGGANYDVGRWLEFYERGLDHIVELNRQGVPIVEIYASIIAKKMLTNDDPGYVDLTSPAGIGIGALVYNYDGDVYACDEGRMLAEMGDQHLPARQRARLTPTRTSCSPTALLNPLSESFTLSAPMCTTCAFEPYCGADPVFHHATMGDFTGHKALSAFCQRNMGVFTLLLRKMRDDPYFRDLMWQWADNGHVKLRDRADATGSPGRSADDVWRVCLHQNAAVARSLGLACLVRRRAGRTAWLRALPHVRHDPGTPGRRWLDRSRLGAELATSTRATSSTSPATAAGSACCGRTPPGTTACCYRAVRQLLPDVLPAAQRPRRLLAVRPGKEGDQPAAPATRRL